MVAGHVLEHGKAIFHGYVDIQQHQRDIAQVLLQQLQAFFAIGCFQNAVIALQGLGEEGAVPLGIVHDQNLTFALLAQIPFPQGEGAGLQHDGILFGFCLVHQGIGTVDGLFQRVRRTLQYRTDAQRKVQMGVAGEGGLLHGGADLLQLALQKDVRMLAGDPGQDQQEFIAAIADEGVGLPDAAPDDIGGGAKGQVACLAAVSIVVNFQVVHIQDGNASGADAGQGHVLIVAAVVHAGEGVVVEAHVVAGGLAHEGLAVLGVDDIGKGSAFGELQHIGLAVHNTGP